MFTKAHPMFPHYQRLAAMRPVQTLGDTVIRECARARKNRLLDNLWNAIANKDERAIEAALDELDEFDRMLNQLPFRKTEAA